MEAIRTVECPYGVKMGELIEDIPPESLYLNMSEERFCETWYGGRVVLVGDGKFITYLRSSRGRALN